MGSVTRIAHVTERRSFGSGFPQKFGPWRSLQSSDYPLLFIYLILQALLLLTMLAFQIPNITKHRSLQYTTIFSGLCLWFPVQRWMSLYLLLFFDTLLFLKILRRVTILFLLRQSIEVRLIKCKLLSVTNKAGILFDEVKGSPGATHAEFMVAI